MGVKHKKHGLAVSGTWTPIGLPFLRSRACASLSPHAAKLLLDMHGLLGPNATRNGDLCIAPQVMAARGWTSRATLLAAVRELEQHELIVKTKQGSRLDCNLFAITLYPLSCDLRKLDVGPGCYTTRDWEKAGLAAPDDDRPARWRRARKSISADPPRNEPGNPVPPRNKAARVTRANKGTLSRSGTNHGVSALLAVPPRVTYLDKPCTTAPTQPSDNADVAG